ncbi:MAG: serine/threonine-protein phosphatase [Candidatus Omnitrophica bacterium]|nr:serine/threonine-protein phosphatase [Candidatus Omnitrophota bacterium]
MSAFCGMLDFKHKQFTYSNYGHPTQYFYRVTDATIIFLGSQTSLLGLAFEDEKIYEHQIDFQKGNKLFLFTDGVIETKGYGNEEYGRNRLEDFIRRKHGLKAEDFNNKLLDELNAFKNEKFRDDIFMLTVDIKK